MNDERYDPLRYGADGSAPFDGAGTGRHRAGAVYTDPMEPAVPPWDPAEELAYLLQEARSDEYGRTVPNPREESSVTAPPAGSPMGNLQEITAELPPLRATPRGHRKHNPRKRPDALRIASYVIAALAAVTVSMVSVFSGVVTYEPLLLVTTAHSSGSSSAWWPVLVYGPWLAGSLSILRAALHQRRALHSWFVVLLFSAVAVMLCVAQAPRTVTDTAAAALPGVAALACFQQLVRQITLTRPPRRTAPPRHRVRPYRRDLP
ncbi:DUF2637 domain-containing protein [Streptomyces virens]|uniref:Uncharacterized protein n=2 Tax=Streptomyces TaxID=1883 RepID=A0A514JUN1_9ACTN|nr:MULTISPECIES: DUF2637 domain-containing protein [Streptomyces]MBA8978374.1 hypothetical protein [Streptomyces calvus]MYS29760.1 DUF2637 domain-containing protein [Streptomyces sp. SID7804]QDI71106.1 hypothetical protein CD934_22285 [Streptomyces calvus]